MSDLDTLRQRGIRAYCVVDATGVALNGTSTLAQILAKGMAPICQVNSVGTEPNSSTTAATLLSRGIKTFCQLNESGVDPITSDSADTINKRGLNAFVAVDIGGIAQNGSKTILQLDSMGLESFAPVDETGTVFTLGGIVLSPATIPENSANTTTVGTASIVIPFTGTPVWSITDATGTFNIGSGTGIVKVLSNTQLNYESHTSLPVTIHVTGTTPTIPDLAVSIQITNVIEIPVNVSAPVVIGSAVEGATLTGTNGTWTDMAGPGAATFAYQWKRGGVTIGGATSNTYTPVIADVGSTLTLEVTPTNTAGSGTAQASAPTATVTKTTLSYSPVTSGTVGVTYTGATPSSSGGTAPYGYSKTGTLPTGLTLDPSSGIIGGIPSSAATFSGIVLISTDANAITDSSSSFSITIASGGGGGHVGPDLLLGNLTDHLTLGNGIDYLQLGTAHDLLLLGNGTDHLLLGAN